MSPQRANVRRGRSARGTNRIVLTGRPGFSRDSFDEHSRHAQGRTPPPCRRRHPLCHHEGMGAGGWPPAALRLRSPAPGFHPHHPAGGGIEGLPREIRGDPPGAVDAGADPTDGTGGLRRRVCGRCPGAGTALFAGLHPGGAAPPDLRCDPCRHPDGHCRCPENVFHGRRADRHPGAGVGHPHGHQGHGFHPREPGHVRGHGSGERRGQLQRETIRRPVSEGAGSGTAPDGARRGVPDSLVERIHPERAGRPGRGTPRPRGADLQGSRPHGGGRAARHHPRTLPHQQHPDPMHCLDRTVSHPDHPRGGCQGVRECGRSGNIRLRPEPRVSGARGTARTDGNGFRGDEPGRRRRQLHSGRPPAA